MPPTVSHRWRPRLGGTRRCASNNPEREARDFGDIAELLRVNRGRISRGELEELCRQFAPPEIGAKLLSLL
jgi:hypothetical protein